MTALASVPRLLRTVLQVLRVGDLCEEELPQLGLMLSMMLQHAPLRSHLLANTALLQHIIQELTVHQETFRHTSSVELFPVLDENDKQLELIVDELD